jgi:hypothetical protein
MKFWAISINGRELHCDLAPFHVMVLMSRLPEKADVVIAAILVSASSQHKLMPEAISSFWRRRGEAPDFHYHNHLCATSSHHASSPQPSST